jgi:uncharacterized zinc-type alcohol dehydrogenase-like protein
MPVQAYAAFEPQDSLKPYQFEFPELGDQEVEIKVLYSGLCHSDLSMLDNDWKQTQYPFVPGHEVIGEVVKFGRNVKNLHVGQYVGLGWQSNHCQVCQPCIAGKTNLCRQSEATIVGRHGGFASHVRAQWQWVIPLPENMDIVSAGPLLCGGVTVFTPLLQHGIQGIHHVGVIGIGGLGHIAIQIYKAWGCKVTAFSSSPSKFDEIKALGADQVLNSTALDQIQDQSFDLIVDTVNVPLDWANYARLLAPEGKFHVVGLVLEPIAISSLHLIDKQASFTGSPTGSPLALHQLLEFCHRHQIKPLIEEFPISQVNHAIEKLRQGKLRYRAVLNMQEFHDAPD